MEQVIPPEQLAARVYALEQETTLLRREVERMRTPYRAAADISSNFISIEEQQLLSATMNQLLTDLNIQVEPIGAIKLQEMMRQAQVEPNELSRGIIAMRDE